MAHWSAEVDSVTSAPIAHTTNLTTLTFLALQGGSSTQMLRIKEVFIGGQAPASAPNYFLLGRDTTVFAGATSNAATLNPLDPTVAALAAPPLAQNVGSTTLPQRSSTGRLLNLSVNLFGGVIRWVAAPGEEIGVQGNTQPLGEVSLSAFTGSTGGLYGAHIIFEI